MIWVSVALILIGYYSYIAFIENENSLLFLNKENSFTVEEALDFDDFNPTYNIKINRKISFFKFSSYHLTAKYTRDKEFIYKTTIFYKEEVEEYLEQNNAINKAFYNY